MRNMLRPSSERRPAHTGSALAPVSLIAALLLGSAASGRAERDRPPPAHTGGFSEPLCTSCHFQADVNTGSGSITLAGLPPEYVPGTAYTLTLTVAQANLAAGGFQMSARFGDGTQAGAFEPADDDDGRVAVTTSAGVQYIHHVRAGARTVAPDTARWRLLWTAPASGEVVFHVAANAADNDESPLGDMIYATSLRTAPGK